MNWIIGPYLLSCMFMGLTLIKVGMIDGYCRRIWGNLNVDKVIPVKRSMFMVRFLNKETLEKALNMHYLMFDGKPVFLKQWYDGIDFNPIDFQKAPIWVQLPGLPLKYWGCLDKLLTSLGLPIKADQATTNRERVGYPRYLVEMDMTSKFPNTLQFKNEKGILMVQPIQYDWIPVKCSKCQMIGYGEDKCRKEQGQKPVQKVWRPKAAVQQPENKEKKDVQEDQQQMQGFTVPKKGAKSAIVQHGNKVPTSNVFELIQVEDEVEGQEPVEIDVGNMVSHGQHPHMECHRS